MRGLKFTVPGEPKSKKSVACFDGTMRNPSANEMRKWSDIAKQYVPADKKNYTGAVELELRAYFERPLSHLKRNGKGLKSSAPERHIKKPDADNLAKFAGDCLTGLAYKDDCQVWDSRVVKGWSTHNPRTEVCLNYCEKK